MTPPMTTREKTVDHAELARLAERCTHGDPWYKEGDLCGRQTFEQFLPQDRAFIAAANPATVLGLLSEIAALKVEKDRVGRVLTTMQEAIPAGYHPNGSGLRLFIAELKDRATQAERQRDELRKALERAADDLRDIGGQSPRPSNSSDPEHENYLRRVLISLAQVGNTRARQALANQGADQ